MSHPGGYDTTRKALDEIGGSSQKKRIAYDGPRSRCLSAFYRSSRPSPISFAFVLDSLGTEAQNHFWAGESGTPFKHQDLSRSPTGFLKPTWSVPPLALTLIETASWDAALLDMKLANGEAVYPVAERLHAKGVPFAFLTAWDGDIDARYCDVPVLNKPFSLAELESCLQTLVGGRFKLADRLEGRFRGSEDQQAHVTRLPVLGSI